MNILFGIHPAKSLERAAKYLNHKGFTLDYNKVFESFGKSKPDILIIDSKRINNEVKKAIEKYNPKIIKIDKILPGVDCPPDFIKAEIKQDFICDALIIGNYKKEYKPYIEELSINNINFKIFGGGLWNVPQYLGYINTMDICNAYLSAKYSLDLEDNQERVLAISISGGIPLSAGKWNVGVDALDNAPNFQNPKEMINLIKSNIEYFSGIIPKFSDRLKIILDSYNDLSSNL